MCKRNRERMSDTYHRLLDAGKSTALSGDTGKDGRHPMEIKKIFNKVQTFKLMLIFEENVKKK